MKAISHWLGSSARGMAAQSPINCPVARLLWPKAHRFPEVVADKRQRVHDHHVAPLNRLVEQMNAGRYEHLGPGSTQMGAAPAPARPEVVHRRHRPYPPAREDRHERLGRSRRPRPTMTSAGGDLPVVQVSVVQPRYLETPGDRTPKEPVRLRPSPYCEGTIAFWS